MVGYVALIGVSCVGFLGCFFLSGVLCGSFCVGGFLSLFITSFVSRAGLFR